MTASWDFTAALQDPFHKAVSFSVMVHFFINSKHSPPPKHTLSLTMSGSPSRPSRGISKWSGKITIFTSSSYSNFSSVMSNPPSTPTRRKNIVVTGETKELEKLLSPQLTWNKAPWLRSKSVIHNFSSTSGSQSFCWRCGLHRNNYKPSDNRFIFPCSFYRCLKRISRPWLQPGRKPNLLYRGIGQNRAKIKHWCSSFTRILKAMNGDVHEEIL